MDTAGGHEKRDGRITAKILAASLLRNLPLGDIHVVWALAEQPLFRVDYSESAILHAGDWPRKLRSKFLQAQFFGTYFEDESGLFLDLMEP